MRFKRRGATSRQLLFYIQEPTFYFARLCEWGRLARQGPAAERWRSADRSLEQPSCPRDRHRTLALSHNHGSVKITAHPTFTH